MTGAERREAITAEIMERTGITEAMIERLVRGFYAKVRSDPMLAPVFEARISDWEPHLQQMCAFWSSVALMSGRYHGTPDGQAYAAAGRRRSFRPLARTVRGRGQRNLSARGRGAFRRTGAADRGKPRTRRRRRAGRHARTGRAISAQSKQEPFNDQPVRVSIQSKDQADPYSGSSLVPMLVIGLVLTFAGMFAAVALS